MKNLAHSSSLKAWWLYVPPHRGIKHLGLLFGLGFDTATEIGLLGISAAQASTGASIWTILVYPTLFTAGMSLVDTTDGVMMVGAYGWAFIKPLRKLYYNLVMTLFSIVVAVVVGTIEVLGVIIHRFRLTGVIWSRIEALNDHFATVGLLIIGVFAACWIVSAAVYYLKGYDHTDLTSVGRP